MKFMGLDVGTTGVKAAVFDESGKNIGYGFESYEIIFGEGKQAEQDAEQVWRCAKKTMRDASSMAGEDIASICVSAQGDAVMPINKNRVALCPALLGMDYRTVVEANRCAEVLGDYDLFKKTGMRPHPLNSLTKMMWFQKNRRDLSGEIWKYATYSDFILLKLGADESVIDLSMASRVMALDLETKKWDRKILEKVNIPESYLSKPVQSGSVIGKLGASLADEIGVRSGALIVAGGHDQPCAALGAGIAQEGAALDSHGTAEALSTVFETKHTDENMYLGYYPCTYHVIPDQFFTFALNHTGGILLQWLRDNFCGDDAKVTGKNGIGSYAYMIDKSPDMPASVMVLPHFNGSGTPWCDLRSKGAILGLSMDTTRHDIVKAMLDSLTYEMKINLERLEQAKVKIETIRCVGGAARSPKWMQLKADIFGRAVETLEVREAACLGAAILAACAAGAFKTPAEALAMVRVKDRFVPDSSLKRQYERKYETYVKIYDSLKQLNGEL
ncbi:MAG: hypothetical protein LBS53_15485 [Synergistaceae bacterium]|nr:hypothetical protein [Synergistaceae bacterium]